MGCLASKVQTGQSDNGIDRQGALSRRWLMTIKRKNRLVSTDICSEPPSYMGVDHDMEKHLVITTLLEHSPSRPIDSKSKTWRNYQVDGSKALDSTASSLHPVIREFQSLIEGDAQLYMLFHMMFDEAREVSTSREGDHATFSEQHDQPGPWDNQRPTDLPVQDYRAMLAKFDEAIRHAPAYTISIMVAFPFDDLLSRVMWTESGQTAFLDKKVNSQLEKILNVWSEFLSTPASAEFLNKDPQHSWFGAAAAQAMPDFVATFECDPSKAHYGFCSWNDFFTRRLRPGLRPVACSDDNSVVINPCESSPYRLAHGVRATDRFWIKEQHYSLDHMLAHDPLVASFYGGTVYQAYLSTFSYHRWHSPVPGRVVKAYKHAGSYFSQAPFQGFDEATPDPSQAYLTAVATRAMIFIEADNPGIGLMCFLPVGIAEVSSCIIDVKEGEYVKKGQDVGHFLHGGSTYCLIFRLGTQLRFNSHGIAYGLHGPNIPVNAAIATLNSCT